METPDLTTLPPISQICDFLRSDHSYYERFDFPESAETTDSKFESILEDDSNFLDVGNYSCAFENTDNNQALVQNDAIHWLDNIQISNCDGNLSHDYKWNTEPEMPLPDQSVVCGEIFQPIGPESAPIYDWNEEFGPMSETVHAEQREEEWSHSSATTDPTPDSGLYNYTTTDAWYWTPLDQDQPIAAISGLGCGRQSPVQNAPLEQGKRRPRRNDIGATEGQQNPGTSKGAKRQRRPIPTQQQRKAANIRERRRMFNLNAAFDNLRKRVPTFVYEKNLSRIKTLQLAISYIRFMDNLLSWQ